MSLPALGGHVIITSPANNQMGHGFYQFSPDLFYRIFSEANGYQLNGLFLVPTFSGGDWFKVKDPALVRERVGHNSAAGAVSLFAIAQRVNLVTPLSSKPQQSDYAAEWAHSPTKELHNDRLWFFDQAMATERRRHGVGHGLKRRIRGIVPNRILRWRQALRAIRDHAQPPDPAHFEPFPIPPRS
jgi:hypothetical protein